MAHEFIRFIPEIGLWSFSRGRSTCRWKSKWCDVNCYAQKFYRMGWAKDEYDKADDEWWMSHDCLEIADEIRRVASVDDKPPARFRFSVKGEIWTATCDVVKVAHIAAHLPETVFWIPTRAWRDHAINSYIRLHLFRKPNVRVLASVDPDTTLGQLARLRAEGWSLVFAGDNQCGQMQLSADGLIPHVAEGMHRCEKTWDRRTSHCASCDEGCFSDGRVEIHLKKHK